MAVLINSKLAELLSSEEAQFPLVIQLPNNEICRVYDMDTLVSLHEGLFRVTRILVESQLNGL